MYKLKLGVSVGLIYENTLNINFEYQIKKLKSLGFDSVDLNLFGSNKPAVYEQVFNALPDLVKIIKDNGLYLNGVHLPFGAILDISSPDEELAKRSLDFAVKVVKEVDMKNLLIETDAPYLTPHPYRGKLNEPKYIPFVAKEMAKIKNISEEEVACITYDNACELFGINKWK